MATLEGKWKYRSYCPTPASAMASSTPPTFETWSKSDGDVTISQDEKCGTLIFPNLPPLGLTIRITSGTARKISISACVDLAPGVPFTNELEGWEVPADLSNPASGDVVIRGAIIQTSTLRDRTGALVPPPIFTTGFFVLQR